MLCDKKGGPVKNFFACAALCAVILAIPNVSYAANARDYIPMPDGTFLFCTYFKHITANSLFANGRKASNDFNLRQNIGIFRPVIYKNIGNALVGDGGFIIDPQALIPFGEAHLDGAAVGGADFSTSGIGDPTVLATFWFVNDPKNKFWVGFSPYITLPLGKYNNHRTLNMGSNRWAIKPELGVVKGFGEKVILDLIINGEFYTDNDKFSDGTGTNLVKREQDPVLGAEVHLSYDISKTWYASIDYFYSRGGESKLNGVRQKDTIDSHGLGISLFWLIGTNNQLMVEYRDDFAVRNGPGTNTFGVRWAYFF